MYITSVELHIVPIIYLGRIHFGCMYFFIFLVRILRISIPSNFPLWDFLIEKELTFQRQRLRMLCSRSVAKIEKQERYNDLKNISSVLLIFSQAVASFLMHSCLVIVATLPTYRPLIARKLPLSLVELGSVCQSTVV